MRTTEEEEREPIAHATEDAWAGGENLENPVEQIGDIGKVELVKVPVTAKTDIEVPLGSVGCRYYDSQGNQLHNPLPILFDPEQFTSGQQGIMILPIPLSIKSQLTNVEILVAN